MQAASVQHKELFSSQVQLGFLFDDEPVSAPILPFVKKVTVEAVAATIAPPPKPPVERTYFRLLNQLENLGSNDDKAAANIAAIKLLKALSAEKRTPTADEQDVLVRYTGWGGIPQVFVEGEDCKMPERRDELKAVLSEEEWAQARSSTLNAHYTPPEVIDFMWSAVAKMGFKGGKTIEPAVGIGHFIGRMPIEMRKVSEVAMVEPNSISAGIAKALYPEAVPYIGGIETACQPESSFDLAISNVPFGDYRVFDSDFDRLKFKIHDYFFAKALSLVRPGGLVAFVTSHYTMDKSGEKVRAYLADKADLVGAFRMHSGMFKGMANTDVVADILFLRKRKINDKAAEVEWLQTGYDDRTYLSYNKYFKEKPEHVAGRIIKISSQFGPTLGVKPSERSFSDHAEDWLQAIPADLFKPDAKRTYIRGTGSSTLSEATTLPVGSFIMDDGEIKVTINARNAEPRPGLSGKAAQRIAGMIRLRDTTRELLKSDRDGLDSSTLRSRLNYQYDTFVRTCGHVSDRANRLAFKEDPSYPLVLSLEYFDDDDLEEPVRKAPIFTTSTVSNREIGTTADTISHAVALSLNVHAKLVLPFMAQAMSKMEEEVRAMLFDADLAYLDPLEQQLICKDEYLSGNVRTKLAQAMQKAQNDTAFERNVKALQAVLPVDLVPEQIDVVLGAPWLSPEIIEQFIESVTERKVTVHYAEATAMWKVAADRVHNDVTATQLWGTVRLNFYEIVDRMLNALDLGIYDIVEVEGKEKRVFNAEASAAVGEKAEAIRTEFKRWLWGNEDRSKYLCGLYNNLYNSEVNRSFDGSHMVIPGLSATINLRSAQKDSVWRILTTGNTLLALAVGGGKTLIQIVAAMEAKRLGIASKPVIVVPNHMLEQFAAEFMRAYPSANLLAASKEDLVKEKRQLLLSRIATGNWDTIIMTHSSFEKLALSQETVQDFIDDSIAEIDKAMLEVDDTRLVKQLESQKKRIEEKLKSLLNRASKDQHLSFDDLGLDLMLVDEAHLFKNLWFATKRRCAGISTSASMRAFDMYLKTCVLQKAREYDGHGVVFATATPIANSLGEMFTMQRYLQEKTLHRMKIGSFDAWANNFAREVTAIELGPDGSSYRMHTRFAKYCNVPDLMRIFKQVAEIRTKRMLALPEPQLKDGKHTVVSLKPSMAMKAFVQDLVARAEKIRAGEVKPYEDNMLLVTGEGRKAALDMRLVGCFDELEVPTKIQAAASNIHRIWEETAANRSTQIAFCDLSTPSEEKFSVYNQLREDLVYLGIPLAEIAFIHDYDSDLQKAKLFRMVRSGKVRVVLGSTAKLGFGTNIQDRLIAEHHLDAPWRPADVEQRDGRILRQGNMNDTVWIFRYVTEGSFDAYIWQTLETKATFIAQVMESESDVRTIEDTDVAALSYAEVKALASGNPIVIEKAGVDNDVAKYALLQKSHTQSKYQLRNNKRRAEMDIEANRDFIRRAEADLATMEAATHAFVVGGISYTDPKIGALSMYEAYKQLGKECQSTIGQYCGLSMEIIRDWRGEQRLLKGSCTFDVNEFNSATGCEQVLRNFKGRIPATIAHKHEQIAHSEAQIVICDEEMDKPWEHAEKFAALLMRQSEIDQALGLMENAVGAASLECDELVKDEAAETADETE